MNVRIEESWRRVLQTEFDKPYFELLTQYVRQQYTTCRCYPPAGLIFNAFDSCPFDKVRVVIIGQDPYHEPGQAMGLYPAERRLASVGGAGRAVTQRYLDRRGAQSRKPPRQRMGRTDGCRYRRLEQRTRAYRVYVMGLVRATQRAIYRPTQAPCAPDIPSVTFVRLSRL